MTTRSPQTINDIKLHNNRPDEMTLQVHTPRFIISFPNDTNRVFYEIKDPSIQGEPFNVILIMICYELSGHQLCRNIDFVSSFFTKIVLHLRSQIPKLLKYHKHIELIRKFFNEPSLIQYMVIPVSCFELEVHQNRTRFISKTSKKDSSYIRTKFEEYGTFLEDSCSQIASALSKMRVQVQAQPQPQQKQENAWTQRQVKLSSGKEMATQTQTQTPAPVSPEEPKQKIIGIKYELDNSGNWVNYNDVKEILETQEKALSNLKQIVNSLLETF
jgi:hypothetical protein